MFFFRKTISSKRKEIILYITEPVMPVLYAVKPQQRLLLFEESGNVKMNLSRIDALLLLIYW
jgi:hypothetical protein